MHIDLLRFAHQLPGPVANSMLHMPLTRIQRDFLPRWVRPCLLTVWLLAAGQLSSQAVGAEPANKHWTPSEPRLDEVRSSERRRLKRLESFVENRQWEDAILLAVGLLEENSQGVVQLDQHLFVSVAESCHRSLASLPPEALEQYRHRVDASAGEWYRQGVTQRDRRLLQRVVDQAFCSEWGDDALLALGELALERGDYRTARRYWQRISPQLQRLPVKTETQQSAPLVFPDTDIPLEVPIARLALVSLRAGDLQRAQSEIAWLETVRPAATGRLAGRDVPLARRLSELLDQATETKTATESLGSTTISPPAFRLLWSQPLSALQETSLPATFPVAIGSLLFFQDATGVQAVQLQTGQPAFGARSNVLSDNLASSSDLRRSPAHQPLGQPYYYLTAADRKIFGVLGGLISWQRPAAERSTGQLWGLDLQQDAALCLRLQPEQARSVFAGPPVIDGGRLLVPLRSSDPTDQLSIVSYEASSGQLLWQRSIAQANTPATRGERQWVSNRLALDAGEVFVITNLGVVASLRSEDGQPHWVRTYPRTATSSDNSQPHAYYRGSSPAVLHGDTLLVAPTDSRDLLAMEANTGRLLWRQPLDAAAGQLIANDGDQILLGGRRLRKVEIDSGKIETDWAPDLPDGVGQALSTGNFVYWPTDRTIELVDRTSGKQLSEPVELPEPGGANLLLTDGLLVAAGPSRLSVFHVEDTGFTPTAETVSRHLPHKQPLE